MTGQAATKVGLKQETNAISAVVPTLLGTILLTTSRLEARIEGVEIRLERVQAEFRAEINLIGHQPARSQTFTKQGRIDRYKVHNYS